MKIDKPGFNAITQLILLFQIMMVEVIFQVIGKSK